MPKFRIQYKDKSVTINGTAVAESADAVATALAAAVVSAAKTKKVKASA